MRIQPLILEGAPISYGVYISIDGEVEGMIAAAHSHEGCRPVEVGVWYCGEVYEFTLVELVERLGLDECKETRNGR